jgi:hypothetical protein
MFSTKMPLFGKASKSPTEVVRNLKEDLTVLEKGGDAKKLEKVKQRTQIFDSCVGASRWCLNILVVNISFVHSFE